ncbi:MAG: hypothetical protein AAF587_02820 [Bacteroidota bacterium]
MKNWQLFFSVFASLALIAKPTDISVACGFDPDDFFQGYSFFDPVLTQQDDFSPLFLSMDRFYDYSWDTDSAKRTDNLEEWKAYHKGKPELTDLATIVYKVPAGPLEEMKAWLEGKGEPAPADSLQQNSVVAFWKKNKWSMPACYLDYAKRCEPYVAGSYDPWEEVERDTADMSLLISEGIEKYTMTKKDAFLQLRYAYQVIRLAHYSNSYQEAIDLFDELVPPVSKKANSQLYYWALAHKAGAMRSLGHEIEAAYLFSQVFAHCPAKRVPAWLSFRVENDDAWSQLMAACASDAEKANLFVMRAIRPSAYVLEEMQAIYAIDPALPELRLLLSREINKLENDLFGWDFDFEFPLKTEYDGVSVKKALEYRSELEAFVRQCNRDGKVANQTFWKMAEGYLAFMDSRFDQAESIFATVSREGKDPQQQEYARLFQWVCQVSRLNSLPRATENRLFSQLSTFAPSPDPHLIQKKARDYLLNRFRKLYESAGEDGKAFLCRFGLTDLQINADAELVDDLIEWVEELQGGTTTSLEQFFLSKLKIGDNDPMLALQELKATLLMREGYWEDALVLYEKLPEDQVEKVTYFRIPEDPFEGLITDCFGCFEEDFHEAGPGHYAYNRMTFARKMVELMYGIEQDSSKVADNSFLLGNAIYNTSDFGVCWMATDYYRGGYEDQTEEYIQTQRDAMVRARAYFDAVVAETADLELAAKALFMASKCEQVMFYLDGYDDWKEKDLKVKLDSYREYSSTLLENYKNTQFCQEALRECTYLQTLSWIVGG